LGRPAWSPHGGAWNWGTVFRFIDLSSRLDSQLLPFITVVLAFGFVLVPIVFRSLAIPLIATVMPGSSRTSFRV
jgi:hypothetical protein